MLAEITEILHEGDARGNGMAIRITMPSGLVIFGFATRNKYGGDWDYGPTWNYLVCGDEVFLVDTGRWGMGGELLEMIRGAGVAPKDIASIVISHGHEDHDGGLRVVAEATGASVRAHLIYRCFLRPKPEHAPDDFRSQFPPSCWHCFMPESFTTRHCVDYHRGRRDLSIEPLGNDHPEIDPLVSIFHLPGHTPDSVALLVGDEVLLAGDVILPEITTFPSSESEFERVRPVLPPGYDTVETLYGLRAYLSSLKNLRALSEQLPDLVVLPGHRLFWHDRWNQLDLGQRVTEVIEHHIERCGDILEILDDGPKNARQIAERHFADHLLEGYGIIMAEHEILSHCELLAAAGDIAANDGFGFEATGNTAFENLIESVVPG
jgi:glyoxylase-like metal-dependent hydrolase (beta-lactamase superfamily II)